MANGTASTKGGGGGGSPTVTNPLAVNGVNPPNNLTQVGEQGEMNETQAKTWIEKNTNIPSKDVKSHYQSVNEFTGPYFTAIRAAQKDPSSASPSIVKAGNECENYIKNAPQWNNSQPLYRGINVDSSVVSKIQVGKPFDVHNGGTASWSTKKNKSEGFASFSGSETPVLFTCKKMTNATPIQHLSHFPEEHEILASKSNNYRVISKQKANIAGKQGYIVEVEQIP